MPSITVERLEPAEPQWLRGLRSNGKAYPEAGDGEVRECFFSFSDFRR